MVSLRDQVDEIKSKIRISEEISKYTKLVHKGKDLWCLCFFHKEKTPSMKINDELSSYYCFGCGAKGDLISFFTDYLKYTFKDALHELGNKAGVKINTNQNFSDTKYNTNEKMISSLTNSNPDIFLEKELELRRSNNLPPFQRFISLIVTGTDEKKVEKDSVKLKNFIEKFIDGKVLGPVNAPIFRLKRKFRVRLLVRGKKSLNVQNSLGKIISKFKFSSGIKLTVDVDPINFN